MQVGATRHLLPVDLVIGLSKRLIKLRESLLVVSDWYLNLSLLDLEAGDLLANAIILILLQRDKLLGIVVLLLDLGQLD